MSENALIHIVDDDASIRRMLERLFASIGIAAQSYASAQDFLDTDSQPQVHNECLVLDVRMPGISGLDFQDYLARSEKSLPVVMMTGHGDIPMSVRAMKAGATDFLTKPFRDQEMLDAVMAALTLDRERRALTGETARVTELFQTLSPRERQVMRLVTAGRLNKQIAGDLDLAIVTVKIHRKSVMRKMKVKTLADLVRIAAALRVHSEDHTTVGPAQASQAAAAMLDIRDRKSPDQGRRAA